MSAASKLSPAIASRSSARRSVRSAAEADAGRTERLLARKLSATAQQRAGEGADIARLAAGVDFDRLAAELTRARLLPLLGSRLVAAAPEVVPAAFRDALDSALAHGRRRAALVEQVTERLVERLESERVEVVALKGPHLAERLHGDAAMRISGDIDLLVRPEDFEAAVGVLAGEGYRRASGAPWMKDLPLFETTLHPGDAWRPPIDLHWRLHWYEERFSRDFVRRSVPGRGGLRTPQPLDDLAALLLFWCRDGLVGLRHGADIAAWWDRHVEDLAPCALDEIAQAHPQLLPALTAAALHAELVVGVPAGRLLSTVDEAGRRTRLAVRCVPVDAPVSAARAEAEVVLVDGLLTPHRGGITLLRRHLAPPTAEIDRIYDLRPRARIRRALRRAYYAVRVGARLTGAAVPIFRAAQRRPDGSSS